MKKMLVLIILLSCVVEASGQKSLFSDLLAVVEAERAFARTATEKGVRDSFLAFIAND
ncbi:MAG: hypothetical protein H7Y30_03085, partial [Pyrinomonadaceae bacterium]|nr:hypothetical protein [Pyrinomonadaceae bacterium]